MTTQDLINNLQALIAQLGQEQSEAIATGDYGTAASILSAQGQLMNSVTSLGAGGIVEGLPSDANGTTIRQAITSIGQATKDLAANVKSVQQAVSIATSVGTMVTQIVGGNYVNAATTAAHVISLA